MLRSLAALTLSFVLVSCQSAPPPRPVPVAPPQQPVFSPPPASTPMAYHALPGWNSAQILPGLEAFKRSCARIETRPGNSLLSAKAAWAGSVSDWTAACAALDVVADEASARTVMETLFVPIGVSAPDGKSRFTGYFEPMYEARRSPVPPFTEPVPALPADLIPNGASPLQRLPNGQTRAYPARKDIVAGGVSAIAYAHPSDVFFLQIQGSGRLTFPDGSTTRAVYAAHNGQPFRSTANWLIETGRIRAGEASMQGIRAWMDRAGPAEARLAMNQNPRFVFFRAEPEGDPSLGPVGAQGVPLTPLGSMAVDTDIQPLGVPMFVETSAPGLGGAWSGLLVSQDTGGAIKGAVRGDLYFGTGMAAGDRAGTMNAPGRLWVLLPRAVAARLLASSRTASTGALGGVASAP
ncbi:murein transglycosylase A [Hyphomonas johnsonii]|nr:MltA domain-containing protein [Hyphomonas johnsonii]